MKNFSRIIIAVLAILAISVPANAQFRIGIKGGLNVNSLSLSSKALDELKDPENRTGWTAGLTTMFTVPIIGLGFDASVMYTHRISEMKGLNGQTVEPKNDYIEIPINLRYNLNLPALSSIIAPYIATGPDFAFLCSKKEITEAYKNKSVDVTWNIGAGVLLVKHLQIGASYGIGMNKVVEKTGIGHIDTTDIGRTKCWTVTAAYYF